MKEAYKQFKEAIALSDTIKAEAVRTFGMEHRSWREKEGVSLRSYAKKIGVSPAYLSDVERGNRRPSSLFNSSD